MSIFKNFLSIDIFFQINIKVGIFRNFSYNYDNVISIILIFILMTTEYIYNLFLRHSVISTDTRKIAANSLFFALKGDKFDANTFAKQAIEAGAAYAIIDDPAYRLNEQYILVDDVLTTLQELARGWP